LRIYHHASASDALSFSKPLLKEDKRGQDRDRINDDGTSSNTHRDFRELRGIAYMTQNETHQRLMAAIAVERQRIASRRGFLRGAAKAAGGGALALAALPATGGLRSILAQDFTDDIDILNYALTLEHLEHAFYRDGLEFFTEEDFANLAETGEEEDDEAVFGETDDDDVAEVGDEEEEEVSIHARLTEVRNHELAHVETLTQMILDLGGVPVGEAAYDFGYGDDPAAFLATAQALENTGVAAYAGAAPQIQDEGILAAAVSIHSVEARHAAYLNRQNGESPFLAAFDDPLTPDEVLEVVGAYIVGEAAVVDEATPADEVPAAEAPPEEAPAEEVPTEVPPTEAPPAPTEPPPTATQAPPPPTEVPPTPTEPAPALPTGTVEDEIIVPATSTP
jgi:hypothetical protein